MPEHTLRHLADDAGDAVDLPDFRDLVQRARRRRRSRRTYASVAALGCAAVVAATVLVSGGAGDRTAPPVTSPSPTETATPTPSRHHLLRHPVALVNQPDAHVVSTSYADPDHAAALWEVCSVASPDGICPEVVTWTSDGWQTSRARVIPDKLAIYALPDGSVVVWLFDGGFVLDADGHQHDLIRSPETVAATPGGHYVNLPSEGGNPAGMLDTHTGTVYRPLSSPRTRCVYDDQWDTSGTIWEDGNPRCGGDPRTVAWSSDLGSSWSTRSESRPILGLAVTARRTAVLLGSRYNELAAVDVTTDGGHSWHRVILQKPILAPDRFATTPDGALFVSSDPDLWAADDSWSSFHQARPPSIGVIGIATGAGVVASYGPGSNRIEVSTYDVKSWHGVPPPPSPAP
jgi:hypothetical protein